MQIDWKICAETAQEELLYNFWNNSLGIMNQCAPYDEKSNGQLIYWWHAHVIDVLLDGYERTREARYLDRVDRIIEGVRTLNGGKLLHNWYDDMEWMALALLRAYDATKKEACKQEVLVLWESIKTAWNDHMGGGMAWKKDQLDYKNTPANGPASILASRLYQRFGCPEDLQWALRIYNWIRNNLVDTDTGFVWDGLNRLGDGKIDYDWEFTYCQGVYIGAGIELYRICGDKEYLNNAIQTAETALNRFFDQNSGMLPDEGLDDCGLFKGIFVRYLIDLYKLRPDLTIIREKLIHNASTLWQAGRNENGLISRSWCKSEEVSIQLCAQLSGLMLLEMIALLPPDFDVPTSRNSGENS